MIDRYLQNRLNTRVDKCVDKSPIIQCSFSSLLSSCLTPIEVLLRVH